MAGIQGMKRYSLEIKQEAIRLFFEENKTKKAILEQLGIRNPTQLKGWIRQYRRSGMVGLVERKSNKPLGRPRKNKAIETIEEKIKRLEMENELLKKLLE